MKRRSLTKRERAAMAEAQHHRCVCGCDQPLGERTIAEHWTPVAMRNEAKPDCLLRADCAASKTRRDVRDIWHVKRIRARAEGRQRPKRAIPNRGFDKRLRKRMDGHVEART